MKFTIKTTLLKKARWSTLLKKLMLFACFMLVSITQINAQTKQIAGTVSDEFDLPLAGVAVKIQGTTTGSITDLDGNYSLATKDGDVLLFSYIGMKPQTITVKGQTRIDVKLQEDANVLAETVVIGYGSAKKMDLTGSIVTVNTKEIADRPSSNPLASVQGKIAGVQIINSGRAGQDPEIRIRGTNSLNGYKPLYVVDGLFSDNINYLNPADIESMNVLKDPSSLAIFGIRGANGVIIITTKKAKEGQTIVNINSSVGWKKVTDKISMANAAQFREMYDQQLINTGKDPFDYTNWDADTNWQDEIFRTAFITNNNVSITGSTEKSKFYLGVGYSSEDGLIQSEKYSRVTVNLNSEYALNKSIKFGYQVNGSRTLPTDAKGVGPAVLAAPITPKYATWENPINGRSEQLIHATPSFQRGQVYNPLIAIEQQGDHNKATNYRVAGNIYGEAKLFKDLTFKATLSLDYASNSARQYTPVVWVYNPELKTKENFTDKERISQTKSEEITAQQEYILTYIKSFGLHNLTATAGITTNYREYTNLKGERSQGLDAEFPIGDHGVDKWWLSSMDKNAMTNDGSQWRRFTMSYLARALYNYDNKYLFNASYRRDGSSIFRGVDNTWDNFFSFGTGWVMTNEKFMQDQKIVDHLKLKGSWGVLGTENTGTGKRYPSYPGLTNTGSAVFGDNIINSYNYQYLVRDLRWEKTYSWEVGFETTLLNQRLRFEPIYYSKKTDQIIVQLPPKSGAQNSLENLGEVENKGWEFTLSWDDKIKGTDFTYGISANLTTIDNKVISLGDEGDAIYDKMSMSRAGYPIASFYGYKVIGVYQNDEHIRRLPPNTVGTARPGDLIFADIDGDGKITPKDRTTIGNPTPDFTYGVNINLGYKGFDFSMDMMGVYGNEIYRDWGYSGYAQFNYRTAQLGSWKGEGTSNWEPILDNSRSLNTQHSSYFIEDGSYFRIRNIQLGYTFNQALLKKIYLKSLRVYGNVQNPKTWKKNTSYTSEVGGGALSTGVDNGTYPVPAIYTIGVNVTF